MNLCFEGKAWLLIHLFIQPCIKSKPFIWTSKKIILHPSHSLTNRMTLTSNSTFRHIARLWRKKRNKLSKWQKNGIYSWKRKNLSIKTSFPKIYLGLQLTFLNLKIPFTQYNILRRIFTLRKNMLLIWDSQWNVKLKLSMGVLQMRI